MTAISPLFEQHLPTTLFEFASSKSVLDEKVHNFACPCDTCLEEGWDPSHTTKLSFSSDSSKDSVSLTLSVDGPDGCDEMKSYFHNRTITQITIKEGEKIETLPDDLPAENAEEVMEEAKGWITMMVIIIIKSTPQKTPV